MPQTTTSALRLKEMSETPIISSAAELLNIIELTSVTFAELHAERTVESATGEGLDTVSTALETQIRQEGNRLFVRCNTTAVAPDGKYLADAIGLFTATHEFELAPGVDREFVERVALMAIYPFVREAIHNMSQRLGGGQVQLGFFRPGRVPLEQRQETENIDDTSDTTSTD